MSVVKLALTIVLAIAVVGIVIGVLFGLWLFVMTEPTP